MVVLVVGESLVDVVGEQRHPGGSPFNVAVGLGRLGIDTLLGTQLADDQDGALLVERAAESDVTIVSLEPEPRRTSTASAAVHAHGGASYTFDLTWNPGVMPDPAGATALHIGSLGAHLEPGATLVVDLVTAARTAGCVVSYDPNVRLTVDNDPQAWRQSFARIAPHAQVLKMSDEDAAVLFPSDDLVPLARRLGQEALVAITRGSGGALLSQRGRLVTIEAPQVAVADTIGAGDSFSAALLAWLHDHGWPTALADADLADLGAFAARVAAVTCSRPGADPPRRDEL